jgi:hypothetical protein
MRMPSREVCTWVSNRTLQGQDVFIMASFLLLRMRRGHSFLCFHRAVFDSTVHLNSASKFGPKTIISCYSYQQIVLRMILVFEKVFNSCSTAGSRITPVISCRNRSKVGWSATHETAWRQFGEVRMCGQCIVGCCSQSRLELSSSTRPDYAQMTLSADIGTRTCWPLFHGCGGRVFTLHRGCRTTAIKGLTLEINKFKCL